MDPDLGLLERWRAGEREAGQALFARHFAEVYRFFQNKVGGEADELTQKTFVACVAAARQQFRAEASFRTYLFTIARNELYAHLRRPRPDQAIDFTSMSLAEIVTSIDGRIDRARRHQQLHHALSRLPAEQQLLLELHYWHELDPAALGAVFEVSPGAIRVRLLRARRALRAEVAAHGPPPTVSADDRIANMLTAPEPREGEDADQGEGSGEGRGSDQARGSGEGRG